MFFLNSQIMTPTAAIHATAMAAIIYQTEPDVIKIAVGPSAPPIMPTFIYFTFFKYL